MPLVCVSTGMCTWSYVSFSVALVKIQNGIYFQYEQSQREKFIPVSWMLHYLKADDIEIIESKYCKIVEINFDIKM